MITQKKLAVVVLRNNLRITDNAPLLLAQKSHTNIICLYPTQILEGYNFGSESCGTFRKDFIYETLINLKKNLDIHNISLYLSSNIKTTLYDLNQEFTLTIYYSKEVGTQEKEFENFFHSYSTQSCFEQTLLEPFSFDYTKSFSHFKNKALKFLVPTPQEKIVYQANNIRKFAIEDQAIASPQTNLKFKGGEDAALVHVNDYLQHFLHSYLETRALIDGENISTHFSPYLSVGAVSARTVYKLLQEYEVKSYSSKSSYWIFFELLWRDFFHMVMLQSEKKLFLSQGLGTVSYDFRDDMTLLESFYKANTKVDIIDAGIKELYSTGWISNRQRQLLSNYFTKYLGLDFRYGAAFFQKYLIDYNPASNYGNWTYQAGVANDKTYRVFDPIKQSAQYNGAPYIQKWLQRAEKYPPFDYKALAQSTKKEVYSLL